MIHSSTQMKRRATGVVFLALVSFIVCLAGMVTSGRMREAALRPDLNLRPIVRQIQQTPDGASGGFWQALRDTVANRSDILAAAVVSTDGRLLSTYPMDVTIAGQRVLGDPGNDGSIRRPGEPPGRYGSGSLDDPQVESRFRELMGSTHGAGWPALEGRLIVNRLPVQRLDGAAALLVLPRPHRAAYELAAYSLWPAFTIGSLACLVLFWLALPWWIYLDARPRTEKAVPLAVFVMLTNFLGWLTYLVIRPETERLCPACLELMHASYRCCPQCGWSSKARCRQCGRPARSDWRYCPYCEARRPDAEPAAAPFPSS